MLHCKLLLYGRESPVEHLFSGLSLLMFVIVLSRACCKFVPGFLCATLKALRLVSRWYALTLNCTKNVSVESVYVLL